MSLKAVSESRVTWATSVPILVFLGLFILELGPMYATDTDIKQTDTIHVCQTDVRQMASYWGGGIITQETNSIVKLNQKSIDFAALCDF